MLTESWVEGKSVEEKDAQPTERTAAYEDCQEKSIQEFESQKVQSHKGFSTRDTASGRTEADVTTKAQMMPHFSFVHRNGSNSFILQAANYIDAKISVMLLC